jgi:hypothetical protein
LINHALSSVIDQRTVLDLSGCAVLAILGVAIILVVAGKYGSEEGEFEFSLIPLKIKFRWKNRTDSQESHRQQLSVEQPSGEDGAQALPDNKCPQGQHARAARRQRPREGHATWEAGRRNMEGSAGSDTRPAERS